MLTDDFVHESAAKELARKLPSLEKHDYDTIDKLMKTIAKRHNISDKALHDVFVKTYKTTPDDWIKNKLDEDTDEPVDYNTNARMRHFVKWISKILNLQSTPQIEFSYDTEDAQTNHHTGRHTEGDNKVWVYVKNRNMVDIMRTVAHELTHVRQGELDMIKPNSSYPGSPIEMEADLIAGKWIKVYGAKHHDIFQ